MVKLNQVYKCPLCGNIVTVAHAGGGELVCCGQAMNLQEENTVEASQEKHLPVIKQADGKIIVTIGSVEHPMEADHYIEWISVEVDDKVYKQNLKPGDKPEVEFALTGDKIKALAYCNLHGLWSATI